MGFNDEILDLKFIPSRDDSSQRVAMATNSEQVRLVNLEDFDTTLLVGHTAMVCSSPLLRFLHSFLPSIMAWLGMASRFLIDCGGFVN